MTVDRPEATAGLAQGRTISSMLEHLGRFDGPPEQFLQELLAVQCGLSGAEAGVMFRLGPSGPEPIAIHPPPGPQQQAPAWIAAAREAAPSVLGGKSARAVGLAGAHDLYGQPPSKHLAIAPLRGPQGDRGVGAYVLDSSDRAEISTALERLELTAGLLGLYELRLNLQRRQKDLARLRQATETFAAVNANDRFQGAAMALCNEIASRWDCDRVSLGFLSGRFVKVRAMSNTEKFSRKMQVVQDLEATMEECLDQDLEVAYPPQEESTCVCRAAEQLARRDATQCVLSMPMRRKGQVFAVVTLERSVGSWDQEQTEALRLACELATPRLAELHERGRWVGARVAGAARSSLAAVVGSRHTWAKLIAMVALAAVLGLVFIQGTMRANGEFVIRARTERSVSMPYAGHIASVEVQPGDRVRAGDVLARLDTSDLRDGLAKARSEFTDAQTRRSKAMAEGKTAEARIAKSEQDAAAAQMANLNRKIAQAAITAPIDGCIVSGDWKREIGRQLDIGEQLFQVSPLEELYAEVAIPEDRISEVQAGEHKGQLATYGAPGKKIDFVVERVNPIAEVVEKQNIFKVECGLQGMDDAFRQSLKPGMQGIARVNVGRASYGYLWTRKAVNWIRMKLWL